MAVLSRHIQAKQQAPERRRKASRTHVVLFFLVESAHCGSVRTLHVVGIDFQTGLRLDPGRIAQNDVAARLEGLGLPGIGSDHDFSGERAAGISGRYAIEQL